LPVEAFVDTVARMREAFPHDGQKRFEESRQSLTSARVYEQVFWLVERRLQFHDDPQSTRAVKEIRRWKTPRLT